MQKATFQELSSVEIDAYRRQVSIHSISLTQYHALTLSLLLLILQGDPLLRDTFKRFESSEWLLSPCAGTISTCFKSFLCPHA